MSPTIPLDAQPELFEPGWGDDEIPSIEDRSIAFHRANPHVYDALLSLCGELLAKGRTRYSINGLFEVLRWHHAMTTSDPESEYKLNNDYRAFYARLLMDLNPERLDGFFEIRRRRNDA